MSTREAARENSGLTAFGLVLALTLGAWSAPVLGASGIVVECEEAEKMPTLVETASQSVVASNTVSEEVDEDDAADEADEEKPATPAVTTSLPGVSESALPSFRRQMLRTDI